MARNSNGLTAKRMIEAVIEAEGYASKAAHLLGVSRASFYNYLKRYPTVKAELENVREARHEFVESKLMQAIKKGNLTAIIFYLKTQGKHLGYVERQELTGAGGKGIQIEFVNDWRKVKDE